MLGPALTFLAFSCLTNETRVDTIDLTEIGSCDNVQLILVLHKFPEFTFSRKISPKISRMFFFPNQHLPEFSRKHNALKSVREGKVSW